MESTAERIRKAFGQESDQELKDKEALQKADRIWSYLTSSRRKWEYEAWLNTQFYEGEQYIGFNFATKTIQRTNDADKKLTINKIRKNAKYIVGQLNRDHPQIKALPGMENDEAYLRAKKEEQLAEYWYDKQNLNRKGKQVSLDAFICKFGVMKILFDSKAEAPTAPFKNSEGEYSAKGKGEVCFERVDPFEWYPDLTSPGGEVDAMRFVGHAVPRPINVLKANKKYRNTDKLSADQKLAASFMKEAQMRNQTVGAAQFAPSGRDGSGTVIVRELFVREDDGSIRKIVSTQGGVLLQDVKWNLPYFPYEVFVADVQGSLLDGGSPVRDLRSPQKAYNRLNTSVQENADIMGKINWRIPRGSNVNVITDEVGQFLEYDPSPGGVPEQVAPAGLPAYIPQHLDRLEKEIDDLAGNHNASYGRSPGSKASGELVNKLQEGDANNLTLMRDNYDDFWARVYKKGFLTFKENGQQARLIRSKQANAIGQYSFTKVNPKDISIEDDVYVKTSNGMPYSANDKAEFFLNMFKEKAIDTKALLKALDNSDLDNAVGSQSLDIERALEENRMLMKGQPLTPPLKAEDHDVHMEVHTQLIKSSMFKEAPLTVQDAVMKHYEDHIDLRYKLSMISASMNVEPIKRSEAIMYRPNNFSEMTPIEATQIFGKFGVQSDRAEIQQRGGLAVTDPNMAAQQAKAEDMQMMDGSPVQISVADNHQAHIETHAQVMESEAYQHLPEVIKTLFTQHVTQHMTALKSQSPTPGLMPRENYDIPSSAQVVKGPQQKGSVQGAVQEGLVPKDSAAMNPLNPQKRPLSKDEMLLPKGAVDHKLATERMKATQKAQKAKKNNPKRLPKKA